MARRRHAPCHLDMFFEPSNFQNNDASKCALYLLVMKTAVEMIAVNGDHVVRIVVEALVLETFAKVVANVVLMWVLNNAALA